MIPDVNLARYHDGLNDVSQLLYIAIVTILILVIIRKVYMKFTKSGKDYVNTLNALKNRRQLDELIKIDPSIAPFGSTVENMFKIGSTNDDNATSKSNDTTSTITTCNVTLPPPKVKYLRPFQCKFKADKGMEFIEGNDNFYQLYNFVDKKELVKHYYYVSQIKSGKLTPSLAQDSPQQQLYKKIDPSLSYAVSMTEIFDIPEELLVIMDVAKNKNVNNIDSNKVVTSGSMDIKDLAQYINVSINYDITIERYDKSTKESFNIIVVTFNIKNITPRINCNVDLSLFNNSNYKEIVHNTLLNIQIPIFFINKNGIRFINKSTYDWLDLPYNDLSMDSTININNIDTITDHIDPKLTTIIKDMLSGNSKTFKTYYKEFTIEKKIKDIDNSIHLKNFSRNVLLHIEPFEDDKNEVQLMCSITDSYPIHKYIIHNQEAGALFKLPEDAVKKNITELQLIGNDFMIKKYNYSDITTNENNNTTRDHINDKDILKLINNSELVTYVNELKDKCQCFKSFFGNTDMISFARMDLKTKEILACNDGFEELLRFDPNKSDYINMINKIIDDRDKIETSPQQNLYSYDIHYKNHQVRLIFTYNYGLNIIDIAILDRTIRGYLSNNSVPLLDSLYQTSDLPIVTVDKKSVVITSNRIFDDMFVSADMISNKKLSLLSLVPKKDKRKVSKAITDAIKFNSVNHNDTITMITKTGDSSTCIMKCIKSYSKIGNQEVVTISIFPIDDIFKKKEDEVQ